ncbi:hypothetical protein ABZP36_026601 [Zizania latifolia]
MAALTTAISMAPSPGPRRRGFSTVRCSSAADKRQALFSRIAPVYDHVRAKRGDCVLDLCYWSGDLAFLLSQKVGLDGEVGAGFA